MAYSTSGDCPSTHPVPLVAMTVATRFRLDGDFTGLSFDPVVPPPPHHALSLYGGHADFMNGWDPILLERLVQTCLIDDEPCATDLSARPVLDPLTFAPGLDHSLPTAFTPVPAQGVPALSSASGRILVAALVVLATASVRRSARRRAIRAPT